MESSSEEEKLFQMVRDFIESEPNPPISSLNIPNPPSSHHPTSLSNLQDILEKASDAETEVLEKVLLYLQADSIDYHYSMGRKVDSLNKWIVLRLKMDGYDASRCKTSWVSSFARSSALKITGGYEYVDVMMSKDHNTRLIVDIDFKAQFEVARPTPDYTQLVNALPSIFVGNEDKLNEIISLLCAAVKQSLRERGLHIPPWRKSSYMHSKWLSQNCNKLS